MSNVMNKITKQILMSVNTPDFPKAQWIINPDMSMIDNAGGVDFIKISGDSIVAMTAAEKTAVLNAQKIIKSVLKNVIIPAGSLHAEKIFRMLFFISFNKYPAGGFLTFDLNGNEVLRIYRIHEKIFCDSALYYDGKLGGCFNVSGVSVVDNFRNVAFNPDIENTFSINISCSNDTVCTLEFINTD